MTVQSIECQLGDFMRARLPHWMAEFAMFGLKMAWACLFAGAMLGAIILSAVFWPEEAGLAATLLVFWRVQIYFTPFGERKTAGSMLKYIRLLQTLRFELKHPIAYSFAKASKKTMPIVTHRIITIV